MARLRSTARRILTRLWSALAKPWSSRQQVDDYRDHLWFTMQSFSEDTHEHQN